MNPLGHNLEDVLSDESASGESSIEYNYDAGIRNYNEYKHPSQSRLLSPGHFVAASQKMAIRYLKRVANNTGNCTQQLLKIQALLLLVSLHDSEEMREIQKSYFYDAVEIARRYLGEDFSETQYGKEIIATYLSHIDTSFGKRFPKQFRGELLPRIIRAESITRREEHQEKAQSTKEYLGNNTSANAILGKLKEITGPIRLLIIWKESGEVLANDGFDEDDIRERASVSEYTQSITGAIFDRTREYLVTIDRGSTENENQFKNYDLHIIHPILSLYIAAKEDEFFDRTIENRQTIETGEANIRNPYIIDDTEEDIEKASGINDYRGFVSGVVQEYGVSSLRSEEREQYTSDFLCALDICRHITLERLSDLDKLTEDIDRILAGESRGEVLHMVQSILLSRNEVMNGSGYPFGVSKKSIPLEGKLYSIIRAYEARALGRNPKSGLASMSESAQEGYFDRQIYQIFLGSLDHEGCFPKITSTPAPIPPMSDLRRKRYRTHADSWFKIIALIEDIATQYTKGRFALFDAETQYANEHGALGDEEARRIMIQEASEEIQRQAFQEASRLVGEINSEVGMQSVVGYSRHGESKKDLIGKPADKDDPLTEKGEDTSRAIGEAYEGLDIDIYSSEILRALASAELIQEGVIAGVNKVLEGSVDNIHIEPSLANPEKSREGFWTKSSGSRLFTIILDDNTKSLTRFLDGLASPLMERTSLLVTHGHIANIIDTLLENFSRQNGFSSGRITMGNGTVRVYLIQRGNKTKKLLFPITQWTSALSELNTMTMDIFGETFYDPIGRQIGPFKLHRRFVDFIDTKQRDRAEKIPLFIKRLEGNPLLQDFPSILRAEQVIY